MLDTKLLHLDKANQRRKEIASVYLERVKNPLIHIPHSGRDCVWHIFPIFCEQRDELQQFLKAHGVETQIHYPIPPHRQACYQTFGNISLPIAERMSAQELSIPCHQAMTNEEVNTVVDLLNSFN